jgi:DNA polymerase III subunit epsilon
MAHVNKHTFICLDCETTGLDVKKDRIVEVAAIKFTFDEILGEYESLVDPEIQIPQDAIKIHHITQEMVQGKPTIDKVLPDVIAFIEKHPIVGHSISFDIDMLRESANRLGIAHSLHKPVFFDTLRLARLYAQSPTNSLEMLRKHFNIQAEGAHRAMGDVMVNIQVFQHLAKDYKTLEELIRVLSKPIQMKHMPLGKHKGRLVKDLPLQYLLWAARQDFDQDLLYTLRSEINRRKKGASFGQNTNPFAVL